MARRIAPRSALSLSSLLALVALASCEGSLGRPCTRSSECGSGGRCVDGTCREGGEGDAGLGDGGGPDDLMSIRVEPAEVTLEAIDGAVVEQRFEVVGTERDGDELRIAMPYWSLGGSDLGAIDDTGLFRSEGIHGGEASLLATYTLSGVSFRAHATITIVVRRSILGEGVTADVPGRFGAPEADASGASIVYPLEGAVMPANVFPPTVQWSPVGAAGDVFRVRVEKPHASVTAYLSSSAAFAHAWSVDRAGWRAIAESDGDVPASITIDRLDLASGRTIASAATRTVRLARGSLFGRVYFWVLDRGRTESIDPVSAALGVTVPTPPPAADGSRCVACHTVSRDGRWLWGVRGGDSAGVSFDLTTPLTGDPAPTRSVPVASPITMGTFDPSAALMIGTAGWSGPLLVVDATSGTSLPVPGLPAAGTSFPEWSPDGTRIAMMANVAVAGDGHPIDGDIAVLPRTSESPLAFGELAVLHDGAALAGAAEGGTADSHPVWTPDSQSLVFQHGPRTFSFVPGSPEVPNGALYRIAPDGTGLVRLDRANGGADGVSAYWPSFAPYITDELDGHRYYWVAFYSRRDYGNPLAGTAGRHVRQLWIAAIDADASSGDPSFVPYWLPGQDVHVNNVAAYWAPEPCRSTGSACGTSGECCSEVCDMGPDAVPVCMPPPDSECRRGGMTCGSTEDCCGEAECIGNVCIEPPG